MAIATKTQKTIKVGRTKDHLIELPAVKTYDIKVQHPRIIQSAFMHDPNWRSSMPVEKPRISLSVEGWAVANALPDLYSLGAVPLLEFEINQRQGESPTYTISATFETFEEVFGGYEFTDPI
jgi:hypothetical protein